MKKWKILTESRIRNQESRINDVIKILLQNRGLKTKKEIEEFLNPKLENVTVESVGIGKRQLRKAIGRIEKAIKNKEKIVVFGDYDVDGICGTAILWETLNSLGADVMPYIPHRVDEGYGLSIKGIENLMSTKVPPSQRWNLGKTRLIITVDNGIVANKAVEFAKKNGVDVIITDHHVPSKVLPKAYGIVHTTKLCGASVAYMLAQEILNSKSQIPNKSKIQNDKIQKDDSHLELVALATIADLVPLIGANRTLVKFGIEALRRTKRVGLLELFREAAINPANIGVYEIGHIIAPRLNAMGRLEHAMDSLRLLCTKNKERARVLAQKLGYTNRERQELTLATFENSKLKVQNSTLRLRPAPSGAGLRSGQEFKSQNLLFIADASYQQGVIGLVAGKLVDEFYKPAIVVSVGEKYSKASARSVNGFNIIEFIRGASELLVDAGGHPMAAGFTVETSKLSILQKTLEEKAEALLDGEKLTRTLRIDCELDLSLIDDKLYEAIEKLAPFGMGNPQPRFVSRKVEIRDIRVVGREGNHLKLVVSQKTISSRHSGEPSPLPSPLEGEGEGEGQDGNDKVLDAIAFGMGEEASEFKIGDTVDIAYTIDLNMWNGNKKMQLKIKDIKNN